MGRLQHTRRRKCQSLNDVFFNLNKLGLLSRSLKNSAWKKSVHVNLKNKLKMGLGESGENYKRSRINALESFPLCSCHHPASY